MVQKARNWKMGVLRLWPSSVFQHEQSLRHQWVRNIPSASDICSEHTPAGSLSLCSITHENSCISRSESIPSRSSSSSRKTARGSGHCLGEASMRSPKRSTNLW
jgi:hypothetical protein